MRVQKRFAQGLVLPAVMVAIGLAMGLATPARADVNGSIEGYVTDEASHQRLGGVTVTVTSPALQGEQTEFTDADGHYIITELPPGEYLVRFYFSDINVERPGVFVQADKTLAVNVAVPTQTAKGRRHTHPRARRQGSTSATRRCRPRSRATSCATRPSGPHLRQRR